MNRPHRVDGLAVHHHDGPPGTPCVVLVHGSLDRGAAFLRAARHLRDRHVVRYDRRGYGRSADAGLAHDLDHQVDDLRAVVEASLDRSAQRRAVVVGHSLGGVIALAAAQRHPDRISGVGAFEAPTPWLEWWPGRTAGGDALSVADDGPAEVAERFMRRIVGDERWEALPAATQAARRAEGPALVADLRCIRGEAPYEPTSLERRDLTVVLGHGTRSRPHHVRAARETHDAVAGSELVVIDGAAHDAHVSHPIDFATFVRRAHP